MKNMSTSSKGIKQLLSPLNIIAVVLTLISIAVVPNVMYLVFKTDHEVATAVRTVLYIFLGILMGAIVLRSFFLYLEPINTLKSLESIGSEHELSSQTAISISEQINEIKDQIRAIGTVEVDIKDISKDQLIESLKSTFSQRFAESILKSIDEEFTERELKNKQWERFITGFEEIRKRLYEETNNLARRANLNLAVGTITTILAGVGLVVIVFVMPLDLTTIQNNEYGWAITAHYIPRLSFIAFAEIFAYFFLRLYKTGLDDIKYYQNEITNVELKISALKVSLAADDKEILKLVVEELAKAERNFILKKDETTVELEKFKSENLNTRDLLEQLTALIGAKK